MIDRRWIGPAVLAMTLLPSCASEGTPTVDAGSCTPGVHELTVAGGGNDDVVHPVRIFVPSAIAGAPLAAVLDWHARGADGATQAAYTGYEELAEEQGFIAVHPTGIAGDDGLASWQLTAPTDGERDDLAFADALIDELVARWCVDPDRVYSTGMSEGGYFTSRLVCERADRIAAAVSVGGLTHPDDCRPSRPVPYLAYHGEADPLVPYSGVPIDRDEIPADLQPLLDLPIHDEFDQFAADFGCEPVTSDQYIGREVLVSNYLGCEFGEMAFFEVRHGGHTWPGSPLASSTPGVLGVTTGIVEATRDGWVYMRQFALDD